MTPYLAVGLILIAALKFEDLRRGGLTAEETEVVRARHQRLVNRFFGVLFLASMALAVVGAVILKT